MNRIKEIYRDTKIKVKISMIFVLVYTLIMSSIAIFAGNRVCLMLLIVINFLMLLLVIKIMIDSRKHRKLHDYVDRRVLITSGKEENEMVIELQELKHKLLWKDKIWETVDKMKTDRKDELVRYIISHWKEESLDIDIIDQDNLLNLK